MQEEASRSAGQRAGGAEKVGGADSGWGMEWAGQTGWTGHQTQLDLNSSLSHHGRVIQPPWSSDPLTLLQVFRERLNKKCDGCRVNNKHIFTPTINNLPDHQLHEGQ